MEKHAAYLILFYLTFMNQTGGAQTAPLAETPWNFMDTHTIGAYQFIQSNPTYDGRGVVIIIVDTGVDMGVPGLQKTSDGKAKVVDARDFSGQGDVSLTKATIDTSEQNISLRTGELKLTGINMLSAQPSDSGYWMGSIQEKRDFQNSDVKDLNNNGKEDDIFAFVTFLPDTEKENRWVYYLDENGDGDISDEKPRLSYRYNYDTFNLAGRDTATQKKLVTGVLNIYPGEKKAVFHIPDGSHGTHCAGIAAGFQIFGESTMHGIAPGAQIISAKVGNNIYGGGSSTTGAMKKAYQFGVEWSKTHNTPVVFSMSYGIGSELEGRSDIEIFLNDLMEENEDILVVLSNGNEGPGIGSTGNPSSAFRPLSAGAMLPAASAMDSYGFPISRDVIFHFSSRGGEVDKPDCLAPGAAASTVPYYDSRENKWGTSMSCPQIAGAAAVLMSACMQEKILYKGSLIKRSLKYGTKRMAEYTHLDQGTGIVNIPAAFEIMKIYQKRGEAEKLLDYRISTKNPFYPDGEGQTAYWRTGGYYPPAINKQQFQVEPLFPASMSIDQKADFYRTYNLKSDQPWFKLDKNSTYIRGENPAKIGGYYQSELLREPGLYAGVVRAYPKTGDGRDIPEFELLNSVIIPYLFHEENNYQRKFTNNKLKAGEYNRYFVLVPPGASSMNIRIAASPGEWCGIRAYIFDPEGRQFAWLRDMNAETQKPLTRTISGASLKPGIWEIVPFAFFHLNRTSSYDMDIHFDGLEIMPEVITQVDSLDSRHPRGRFSVTNLFRYFSGKGSGEIDGYEKTWTPEITGDKYRFDFRTDPNVSAVRFHFTMDENTYGYFTDIAVNIRDSLDKILKTEGLGQRFNEITFIPPDSGIYSCEIAAGFTYPEKSENVWKLEITQKTVISDEIRITAEKNNRQNFVLYPLIPAELTFRMDKNLFTLPDSFLYSGALYLQDDSGVTIAEVPLKIVP
ncbi:MAG: hypothetical protein EH225_11325 [Calditrichaeota bacterium]|nr:S8 family serine peptidase [Calditrichota bacterium]RQV99592.1 MAG: hypothetical protein EH225_11325 [Calditrichota bacterium]